MCSFPPAFVSFTPIWPLLILFLLVSFILWYTYTLLLFISPDRIFIYPDSYSLLLCFFVILCYTICLLFSSFAFLCLSSWRLLKYINSPLPLPLLFSIASLWHLKVNHYKQLHIHNNTKYIHLSQYINTNIKLLLKMSSISLKFFKRSFSNSTSFLRLASESSSSRSSNSNKSHQSSNLFSLSYIAIGFILPFILPIKYSIIDLQQNKANENQLIGFYNSKHHFRI